MSPAKKRVLAKYPKAYRQRYTVVSKTLLTVAHGHKIVVPSRGIIGYGETTKAAWEAARANLLAEVLS